MGENDSETQRSVGGQNVQSYDEFTDDELRDELVRRGLPQTGQQGDLKAALEENDRTSGRSSTAGETPGGETQPGEPSAGDPPEGGQ